MLLLATSPKLAGGSILITLIAALTRHESIFLILAAYWIMLSIFFRDFDGISDDQNALLSPAEGVIIRIDEGPDTFHIAIRLSLLDCHVQLCPVSGIIHSQTYHPGQFNPVYFFEKTEFNEHLDTVIESTELGRVLVRQIAGQLARRIIPFVKTGQAVEMGQKLGFIALGSRVDLEVLKVGLRPLRLPGQRIALGEPLLAYS